ncbi:ABC transporter permease [Okibacterium endophyticum]
MREQLGLDDPLLVRYWNWLMGAMRGDFGVSFTFRDDVSAILAPRIGTTLTLVAMAAILILVIGIALGTLGGMSRRLRPLVSALIGVGIALPTFVAAVLLIGVFAVGLGWFPTYGAGSDFLDSIWHLTLPAIALSMAWTAYIAQITQAAVREEAAKEHVATAIGRGLPRSLVLRRHVLRNSAIPVLTASGLTVAGLVAGSVIVEAAFAVNGIGSLLVEGVSNKDYPIVLAIAMIIVVVFVVITTVIDIAHTLLDPKRRKAGRTS